MDVAVVLEYDDFASAEAHRNRDGGDASMPTMPVLTSAKNRTTIDPSLFEEIISDNEDLGSTDQTQVGTKRRPTMVSHGCLLWRCEHCVDRLVSLIIPTGDSQQI